MSHVILIVQIPLTNSPPKCVLSLWDHISQAPLQLDHIPHMALQWNGNGYDVFTYRPGLHDLPLRLLHYPLPFLWAGMEKFRELLEATH